jgi:hypothetical protein
MTVRKYQMTRIQAGDYLIPSNDQKTLWRIYSYEEDGSLEDGRGGFVHGRFWASARFAGSLELAERLMHRDPDEFLSWSSWESWEVHLPTRKAAVESMLRAGELCPA